jgi:hypothetical protein
MDLKRLSPAQWLVVAVTIVAVVTMVAVVYQATKPPATPSIDPRFGRSKLMEQSKVKRSSGRDSDAAPRRDSGARE